MHADWLFIARRCFACNPNQLWLNKHTHGSLNLPLAVQLLSRPSIDFSNESFFFLSFSSLASIKSQAEQRSNQSISWSIWFRSDVIVNRDRNERSCFQILQALAMQELLPDTWVLTLNECVEMLIISHTRRSDQPDGSLLILPQHEWRILLFIFVGLEQKMKKLSPKIKY